MIMSPDFSNGGRMNDSWKIFIDLGLIGAALMTATFLRAKIRFFQRFLIPNALTAGFILMLVYNLLRMPLNLETVRLDHLAYHLLNLSFIAMALRKPRPKESRRTGGALPLALGVLTHYGIQATIGLGLTLVLAATITPQIFPGFGFLLPLGFSSGPGQALSIGKTWEAFGSRFVGAGSVGLTFGAVGFLWASFGGVALINIGIRKGWVTSPHMTDLLRRDRPGLLPVAKQGEPGTVLTTDSAAIDSLSYHVAFVLLTYLATWLALTGVTALLSMVGQVGKDLAASFWGIAFIFCSLVGRLARAIITGTGAGYTLDDRTFTRITGFCIDLMIAGALGAISFLVVQEYWIPILIMSTIGGTVALFLVPWMGSRTFHDHSFGRTLVIYGVATGTLASGLALLRVVDPELKTPIADDYMRAAGIVFPMAIPLILVIPFPAYAYLREDPMWLWLAGAGCLVYLTICIIGFLFLRRRNLSHGFWARPVSSEILEDAEAREFHG
jgi:ESS family glutamate:Na+ symporter